MLEEKKWSKENENEIIKRWKEEQKYVFHLKTKKKIYSIDTPPPYVNTPVHMGHACTYVIMDMIARYKRMNGYEVLFPLGIDRNGLPIEIAAEKKFNVKAHQLKREDFIEMCKKILEEASSVSIETFFRCGICFNSWETGTDVGDVYLTDSDDYRTLTQATFIDMWKKGLIYEDNRINNWCPGCRTTLADSEILRSDVETSHNLVRFKIKETDEYAIIATTRPELLCTAALIIYNPKDKRYKHLKGKSAITPIFNIEVPIIEHTSADPNFGTGLVFMSRSAGDQDAVRFLREMNIEHKMAIDIDGRMNDNAGVLKGLKTKEARQKIVELIEEHGLLERQEKFIHSVPICERSRDQIEFIAMPEFYVKQVEFKKDILKLQKRINFYDESSRQILLDWINSVNIDWPISRRRYYATEIPLWYCDECGLAIVPKKGRYYKPWKEKPLIKGCKCGSNRFRGEERVFDTWFDSSISPLYILGYERDQSFFKRAFPCSLRPQGKEIVRTWLYYTILKDYLLTGKLVFKDVWIHQHILDDAGHKMSKSVGNVIDPKIVLDKYGAEALRLWCAIEGNLTQIDFRCSFERIEGAAKSITKLWNVAKFVCMFEFNEKRKRLLAADKWILSEINNLVKESGEHYDSYDFHNSVIKLKHFLWETFASHYIELVKKRVYNTDGRFTREERDGAGYTLYVVLKRLLECFAPIIPIITYKIYFELYKKDIHFVPFPKYEGLETVVFQTKDIEDLNGLIWKSKRDNGLSLKDPVSEVVMYESMMDLERDLVEMHNIKRVVYGDHMLVKI